MTTSTNLMPPAVSTLRDVWRTVLPPETAVDGFAVHLGVAPNRPFSARQVSVAAAWDEDMQSVSVERVESGARRRVTEVIEVACSVFVGAGGVPDMEAWRAQVGETLQILDDALRADNALTTMTATARRGYTRWWDWWDTDSGPVGAVADFVVHLMVLP